MTEAHVLRRGRPSPDLSGKRYTRYVVIGRAVQMDHRARWLCRCDCGAVKAVLAQSLLDGSIKSCGCLRIEKARENGAKAGKRRFLAPTMTTEHQTADAKATVASVHKNTRIADAFADVFREPPDTVHVDRPGARVVRGGRY